jgi:mRNA-degrading endonuclease toxin of MazEF toxin-antitoxin module
MNSIFWEGERLVSIQKKKLLGKLNTLSAVDKNKPANSDPFVKRQLGLVLGDTKNLLEPKELKNVIPFILYQNFWNEYGALGPKKEKYISANAFKRYSRGRLVYADLGLNVGRESSFPHPCIVLYNFKDLLLVVPTTTDDGGAIEKNIEKVIITCPKDGTIFLTDTIIELHQIRCIGKNRIIRDYGHNVSDYILPNDSIDKINKTIQVGEGIPYGTNLLKVIEAKLAYHYAPDIYHSFIQAKQIIKQLEEEKRVLEEEKRELEERLLALQGTYLQISSDSTHKE